MDPEEKEQHWRDLVEMGKVPPGYNRLPWETSGEWTKFRAFLFCSEPRSVRKAYRMFCEQNGIEPKENPPTSWYRVFRGQYYAFRKAERQWKAIQRAQEVHGRIPNWERLGAVALAGGELGKHEGEEGRILDDMRIIDWAFHSLAIDKNGDPLPGVLTWEERSRAYWRAVDRGEVPAPEPGR